MSEEQVQDPRVPYMASGEEAGEERPLERLQVQFPPYFDRFLEERDQRIASELSRLEAAIAHNGAGIARLSTEIESRFAEAKEARQALRVELRTLRTDMHAQFRWTIGLLFPLVAGMLAIIIRVFLVGTF